MAEFPVSATPGRNWPETVDFPSKAAAGHLPGPVVVDLGLFRRCLSVSVCFCYFSLCVCMSMVVFQKRVVKHWFISCLRLELVLTGRSRTLQHMAVEARRKVCLSFVWLMILVWTWWGRDGLTTLRVSRVVRSAAPPSRNHRADRISDSWSRTC